MSAFRSRRTLVMGTFRNAKAEDIAPIAAQGARSDEYGTHCAGGRSANGPVDQAATQQAEDVATAHRVSRSSKGRGGKRMGVKENAKAGSSYRDRCFRSRQCR